jgi:hypothetical protein
VKRHARRRLGLCATRVIGLALCSLRSCSARCAMCAGGLVGSLCHVVLEASLFVAPATCPVLRER